MTGRLIIIMIQLPGSLIFSRGLNEVVGPIGIIGEKVRLLNPALRTFKPCSCDYVKFRYNEFDTLSADGGRSLIVG